MPVRRRFTPLVQATLCAGALGACAPQLPDLAVEQQWADAMKRQSMFAIFPLDEDVMVGDVFLDTRGAPGAAGDGSFDLVRIARTPRIEVARGLCESAQERLFIAAPPRRETAEQPAQGTQGTQGAQAAQGTQAAQGNQGTQATARAAAQPRSAAARATTPAEPRPSSCEDVMRLPTGAALPATVRLADASVDASDFRLSHARIPNITVARLTEAQLGASGLLGNFGANLGLGSGGSVALTIDLKKLQQLQIEQPVAIGMLRRLVLADTAVRPGAVIRIMAQRWPGGTQQLCRGDFAGLRNRMLIAIVTRVLYAGEIDYQFSRSAETAMRLAIHATSVLEGQPQAPSVPDLPQRNAQARVPATTAAELRESVNALLTSLAGGPTGTVAGGNASIVIGSLGGTALKETFPRPLAVGAGASLTYPAQSALLPRNDQDVADVMAFCLDLLSADRPDQARTPEARAAEQRMQWCSGYVPPPGAPDTRERLRQHLCDFLAARQQMMHDPAQRSPTTRSPGALLPSFVPTGQSITGRARLG